MHIPRTNPLPHLAQVSAVTQRILALEIKEGWISGGIQEPYIPQPGETLMDSPAIPTLVWIVKDGKRIGVKVPDPRFGDQRFPLEQVHGDALDLARAEDPSLWALNGAAPEAVFRKTKPDDIADHGDGFTFTHMLYLAFAEDLTPGAAYTLSCPAGLLDTDSFPFTFDTAKLYSAAVHVSQVGFRPDDPAKRAYLSQWMGLGGGAQYPEGLTFELLDEAGKAVFTGPVTRQHDGTPVPLGVSAVTVGSAVWEMDFSAFTASGTYRVHVPGIGCSFPFAVDEKETWLRGFKKSMNGLFCQRSGIETGAPYTTFTRPRCYHPDDGKKVYHSECSLFESGNGLNCFGTDVDNFGNLVRKGTDVEVKDAWGGYFDACDWDRRIQHLRATLLGTELYLMCPDFYDKLTLPIPESGDGRPDILSEGMWNLDHYRRMQTPEGGIRGGVEQEEHPILGQCGWQDTWKSYAYKPDFWSAYWYVATAARMAFALRRSDRALADMYEETANRAFDWAEKEYAEKLATEAHAWTRKARQGAAIQRELAAADLYRLTGRKDADEIFRAIRSEKNYDAAFVYATLPEGLGDPSTREACRRAILEAAERALAFAGKAPFRLPADDPEATRTGPYASFYTMPHSVQLIRAHYLTGEEKYLAGAIDAAQFAAGANPDNLCYTTGIGPKVPLNTLHHDSRITGQPTPDGITLFGPHDWNNTNNELRGVLLDGRLFPGAFSWPGAEGFLDIYRYPCQVEYTVQESIGPNAYRWGYMAARP